MVKPRAVCIIARLAVIQTLGNDQFAILINLENIGYFRPQMLGVNPVLQLVILRVQCAQLAHRCVCFNKIEATAGIAELGEGQSRWTLVFRVSIGDFEFRIGAIIELFAIGTITDAAIDAIPGSITGAIAGAIALSIA